MSDRLTGRGQHLKLHPFKYRIVFLIYGELWAIKHIFMYTTNNIRKIRYTHKICSKMIHWYDIKDKNFQHIFWFITMPMHCIQHPEFYLQCYKLLNKNNSEMQHGTVTKPKKTILPEDWSWVIIDFVMLQESTYIVYKPNKTLMWSAFVTCNVIWYTSYHNP